MRKGEDNDESGDVFASRSFSDAPLFFERSDCHGEGKNARRANAKGKELIIRIIPFSDGPEIADLRRQIQGFCCCRFLGPLVEVGRIRFLNSESMTVFLLLNHSSKLLIICPPLRKILALGCVNFADYVSLTYGSYHSD